MTVATPSWLAALPSTWKVMPAKACFRERREPNRPDDVHLTPSQAQGVLSQAEYMARTGNAVVQNIQGQDNMKHVEPDDFIIHLRSFQGGIERSPFTGKVSTAYTVLEPSDLVVADYFRWLLKSDGYVQELRTTTNQLRDGQSIKFRDFTKIALPVPPREEQRAIADYVDRETARIDTLVEEQQHLIEMLRERRQAVVVHAIGEQINLGAAIDKLGRSARIGNGSTPRRETERYWSDDGFPWLNSSVVNESRVTHAEQFVTAEALSECHLPLVTPGSVLVGLTGQGKTRGMATILDFEATVNQHIAYITPDPSRWLPEYLLWSLRASYSDLRRLSEENGSTKGGLTCEALKQFRLALPQLDQQRRVAEYLNQQTAKIDATIAEAGRFIELSQERRSALIAAAVTGQIDVREVA